MLKRGDFLTRPGSVDLNVYWLVSGALHVYMIEENEAHSIRFGYRNNVIVAMDCFLTGAPTQFYMESLKQSTLKRISKQRLIAFLKSSEEGLSLWTEMLQGLILQQMEREIDLLTTSPTERYERVFSRSPQLFQEIPLKYIASYLRMTPETLSRIRSNS